MSVDGGKEDVTGSKLSSSYLAVPDSPSEGVTGTVPNKERLVPRGRLFK